MKAMHGGRKATSFDLPAKPPGTKDDLRELLRLLYGEPPRKLADPMFPLLRRIAIQTLAREHACRASPGVAPALQAIDKAIIAVKALELATNNIPPPLDTIVIHRLRAEAFQPDALARLSSVLGAVAEEAREAMTGSPDGSVGMGPGNVISRLIGDAPDYLVGEALALFTTFRKSAINADPGGGFTLFISTFWRFSTGGSDVPNLPRRINRIRSKQDALRPAEA